MGQRSWDKHGEEKLRECVLRETLICTRERERERKMESQIRVTLNVQEAISAYGNNKISHLIIQLLYGWHCQADCCCCYFTAANFETIFQYNQKDLLLHFIYVMTFNKLVVNLDQL